MRFFLRLVVILAVPIVLTMAMVRLLTLPWYPSWQYGRAGFPDDPFALPHQERLRLAQASIRFLNIPWRTDVLTELAFDDGSPAYVERELEHMDDVKSVYNVLTGVAFVTMIAAIFAGWGLTHGWAGETAGARAIWQSLVQGAWATVMLLLGLGVWMLVGFDAFFTFFHGLFFQPGTWVFAYSDTLIRLFPLPFWQDAGLVIAGGVTVGALLIIVVGVWRLRRRRV